MTSDSQNRTLPVSSEPLQATVISSHSVPTADLNHEALLKPAPRMVFNQMSVPALGGIPLLAKLGQGGMGAVYFGIHTRLMLEVAVKVLPFQLADQDPTLVQRFFREAQIAAKVKSPHLVSVMDVNEEAGLFYLVMEFVHGRTAGEYCREKISKEKVAGLDEDVALDICIAATEGLIAAHGSGIIHRDIKPENILIPREKSSALYHFKQAKLADLGLARNDQTVQSLTAAQNVMGTPGYMSPEQANDAKNANKPADVFSMGATLYALLAGRAPFSGTTTLEAVLNTIQKNHRPVTSYRPDVSLEVSTLIDRCLAKRPERRFEDAVALQRALQDCRSLLTHRVTRPARGRVAAPPQEHVDDETLAMGAKAHAGGAKFDLVDQYIPPPSQRRKRGSSVLALLCGAALLVGGGLWFAHERQAAEDARKADEAREAAAAKEAEDRDLRAKEQKERAEQALAQRSKDAEVEAMRQKALREAAEAQARKDGASTSNGKTVTINTSSSANDPAVQTRRRPQTAAQFNEKVQRLQRALQNADDVAQRAVKEQNKWADQLNQLNTKRRETTDSINKLRKQIQDARMTLGPPREMLPGGGPNGPGGPGGQGGPNGQGGNKNPLDRRRPPPPPSDDNADGGPNAELEAQMHKWEQDEQRLEQQALDQDKQYNDLFKKYNDSSSFAMDKLNERTKLETDLNLLLKSPNDNPDQ